MHLRPSAIHSSPSTLHLRPSTIHSSPATIYSSPPAVHQADLLVTQATLLFIKASTIHSFSCEEYKKAKIDLWISLPKNKMSKVWGFTSKIYRILSLWTGSVPHQGSTTEPTLSVQWPRVMTWPDPASTPIYDFWEHMKGPDPQTQSCRCERASPKIMTMRMMPQLPTCLVGAWAGENPPPAHQHLRQAGELALWS